ncbi:replication initiator [Arthrobacter sp. lap29]|uniref:replication initiator n=1 Tax=Arthrobacter sp. lap29 TaxID=3056122 RepID=UPI0028F7043C|nr:replication initiator [Arthrobacter sp. lap29]
MSATVEVKSDSVVPVGEKKLRDLTDQERADFLARECQRPIRMDKRVGVVARAGKGKKKEKTYALLNCGSNRSEECMYCAELHRKNALAVIFSGFKDENASRANDCYFVYATFTLPSFGYVHYENKFLVHDAIFRGGQKEAKICRCGRWHFEGDGVGGVPLNSDKYRYTAQAFANHEIGRTFHYARKYLNDVIVGPGNPALEYVKVLEMQRRGAEHIHGLWAIPSEYVKSLDSDEKKARAKLRKIFMKSAAVKHSTDNYGAVRFGTIGEFEVIPPMPENPNPKQAAAFKRPLFRILSYISKYLGKGGQAESLRSDASPSQHAHYADLKKAAADLGYKPRVAANLGSNGHRLSRSAKWGLTATELRQGRIDFRREEQAENLKMTMDEYEAHEEKIRKAALPEDGVYEDHVTGQILEVVDGQAYDTSNGEPVTDYRYVHMKYPQTLNQVKQVHEKGYSDRDWLGDSIADKVERLAMGHRADGIQDLEELGKELDQYGNRLFPGQPLESGMKR